MVLRASAAVLSILGCCPALAAPTHAVSKTALAATLPCGNIGEVGCCHQERVLYCKKGSLQQKDCTDLPVCGWRETGRYDCDTSGSADPNGGYSRLCRRADVPVKLRSPRPNTKAPCGTIRTEGCCFGNELRLCVDGSLRRISCLFNQFCGWRGVAQAYNCGTDGKGDPSGKYPRLCPGAPDSGILQFPDAGTVSGAASPAGGTSGSGGCGCNQGGMPSTTGTLDLSLVGLGMLGLGALVRLRRRSKPPLNDLHQL